MQYPYRSMISASMLLLILACSLSTYAKDATPERAVITAVTGRVTYVRPSESNEPQIVMPLLKLEEGDTLSLDLSASINVLFIARGLGETWQGPKTLRFQDGQLLSQIRGTWTREHPKLLKALVFEPQKIMLNSTLLPVFNQIGGSLKPVPPPTRELPSGEPDKTYAILRKEFGDDDATPNLYRLSVLFEYGQYDRMLPLLRDLLAVYPDNPVLLRVQEWIAARQQQ